MKPLNLPVLCLSSVLLSACNLDDSDNKVTIDSVKPDSTIKTKPLTANEIKNNSNNAWYGDAQGALAAASQRVIAQTDPKGKAKNVILFIGDGMGISTVTAARILAGQQKKMAGEENVLSFEGLAYSGLAKTYNVDAQVPDSAGTATAIMTGVKTNIGVLGVNENIKRGDCSSMFGNELVTALELAELAGKSTGLISTARITHATPAAAYAKSADRNWEDVSYMPEKAIKAGCEDIASQLINFEPNLEKRFKGADVDGLEVVMGGGRRHFLPKDAAANSPDASSQVEGDRTDGRNLITEWKNRYLLGTYVYDQAGFDAINTEGTSHLFGLFNESHMQYEADRANDRAGEPSLSEMTKKAIQVLDNNDKGYFMMVEGGRIDHGHHAGSAYNALTDTIEFAKAVQAAVETSNPEETLIIVTADHSHVMTMAGYPKRGNPILGKVVNVGATEPALASDKLPYTTLSYANGRGFMDLGNETDADKGGKHPINAGRQDLTNVDTTASGFHQESLVPMGGETHAGEDVGIYAQGPGASLVTGTHEQNMIFHIMEYASDWKAQADQAINGL